jgi:hypothetical protein
MRFPVPNKSARRCQSTSSLAETVGSANVAVKSSPDFESAAADEDGDSLTFGLLDSPSGMTIGPASGVIVWTPAASQRLAH